MIDTQGVYTHQSLAELIRILEAKADDQKIEYEEFYQLTSHLIFIRKVFDWDLIIPHFQMFKNSLKLAYEEVKEESSYQGGTVATYIPPLAKADPKWFATGFCSTDGQFVQYGDTNIRFSIQSISKAVAYAFIHNVMGDDVHKWVGEEPSGVAFNAPVFDKQGRPHNPMVNAGAIMVCALIVDKGYKI